MGLPLRLAWGPCDSPSLFFEFLGCWAAPVISRVLPITVNTFRGLFDGLGTLPSVVQTGTLNTLLLQVAELSFVAEVLALETLH